MTNSHYLAFIEQDHLFAIDVWEKPNLSLEWHRQTPPNGYIYYTYRCARNWWKGNVLLGWVEHTAEIPTLLSDNLTKTMNEKLQQ